MIAQLLSYKILQLFLIMALGFIFVKTRLMKSEDIVVLSKLSLYLFMPAASTIMQFSQIYGKDSYYATAINTVTTIGCIITMLLLIMFF